MNYFNYTSFLVDNSTRYPWSLFFFKILNGWHKQAHVAFWKYTIVLVSAFNGSCPSAGNGCVSILSELSEPKMSKCFGSC